MTAAASPALPPRRWLSVAAGSLAVLWIVAALLVAFARLSHPFALEWLGGTAADQMARVIDGKPFYPPPTPDYVPSLYTPLYFYVSGWLAKVTGEGFLPMRLVSIAAAIGTGALLAGWVRQATASRFAGWLAIGGWAAGYFLADTWYDIERVDSLLLLLCAAGIRVAWRGHGLPSAGLAAGLLLLAYFTKQMALPIAAALGVALSVRTPRRGAIFLLLFTVGWFVSTWLADLVTDGWFSFYTWKLPRGHECDWSMLGRFWLTDGQGILPGLALALWYVVRLPAAIGWRQALAQVLVLGGLVASCLLTRSHYGGAINAILPLLLGGGFLLGAAWHLAERRHGRERACVQGLVLAQFLWCAVDFGTADRPRSPGLRDFGAYVPTAADRAAGERIMDLLRTTPGDVLIPCHGYLPRLAGKAPFANPMAVHDVRGPEVAAVGEVLRRDYFAAARTRRSALVVLDDSLPDIWPLVVPGYTLAGRLFPEGDSRTFLPRVGMVTRPMQIWKRD